MPLHNASPSLAVVVNPAARGKPTVVKRRGKPEAVVVGHDQWQRLTGALPTFAEALLALPEGGDLHRDSTVNGRRKDEQSHR